MINQRDTQCIFEQYKFVHTTPRTRSIAQIIKEQYNINDASSIKLATLLEKKADEKTITDIVNSLITEFGISPQEIVAFAQEISQLKTPEEVQMLIQQRYPQAFQAMNQLQTSKQDIAESMHAEDASTKQIWNNCVIQFLHENIDVHSASWQCMLKEAAHICKNSKNILLEFNFALPQQQSNYISKLQEILNLPNIPDAVKADVQSIISKQYQPTGRNAATAASPSSAPSSAPSTPSAEPPPLPATSSAEPPPLPSASSAEPPASPATSSAEPPPLPAASDDASAKKPGFFGKLKGALGKGMSWVKGNKWKALAAAGGIAALAGAATALGPAAVGAAILSAATSGKTAAATGAGMLGGGIEGWKNSGQAGLTGMDRAKNVGKNILKRGGQAFAGATAAGTAGNLIGGLVDKYGPSANIAPQSSGPQRTIDANNPAAPDYQTAAANRAETLGPKGIQTFDRYSGATDANGNIVPGREEWAWNPGSTVDQSRKYVQQVSNQLNPGSDDHIFNSYEKILRNKLGSQEKATTGLANLIQTLKDRGDDSTLKQIATGKLPKTELVGMIKGLINSSYEYKGDSQMLWEAYKNITLK